MATTTKEQINQMRIADLKLSAKIDKKQTKKEQKLTFAQFSKKLEYRRNSVYLKGKHLFNKVSNEMNLLNEKLFYDLFIQGELKY